MATTSRPLDIAVAGCGPAGLCAALLLRDDGHRVSIFERFEAPRPVGSGLLIQPTGLAVLARLGLAEALLARGARIDALHGIQESGRVALDARYTDLGLPGAFGIGIHRASLFDLLYKAAVARGIPIVTGSETIGVREDAAGCELLLARGGTSGWHDLVIDATGWNSRHRNEPRHVLPFGALWATLPYGESNPPPRRLEQRYRGAAQMAGLLPIGRRNITGNEEVAFFWSLRGSDHVAWRERPIAHWKRQVLALWPDIAGLLEGIADHSDLTFARYSHRTVRQGRRARQFVIGDAWHSASPQLGQGANMAMLDGWALAAGLREGRTLADGLRLARAWRSEHVQLYQVITALFTPLYQSNARIAALVRDRLLAPASRVGPIARLQAALMSGLFGWPLAPLGLDPPDYPAIASSIAPRTSGSAQSRSPVTRQTSLPRAS